MRCAAAVWKRDQYRRTGRGVGGFEMHYERCQCKRNAKDGKWCWQHDETDPDFERPLPMRIDYEG
jgi:hypothetical protein